MDVPKIDKEFKALLPSLESDEYNKLLASLQEEGCRDAILVWQGLIVDGHNRFELCEAEGIGYKTREMGFPDRTAAMLWMLDNQEGRRNLNASQRAMSAARRVTLKAGRPKANSAPGALLSVPNLAEKVKVSPRSVQQAKTVLESGSAPLAQAVTDGKVSVKAAAAVANLPPKERAAVIKAGPAAVKEKAKEMREGTAPPPAGQFDHLPEAIRLVFEEAGVFEDMLNALTKLSTLFNKVAGTEGKGKFEPMLCGTAIAHKYDEGRAIIQSLRFFITSRKPFNVCPWCRSKKKPCEYCKSGGWVTKHQFDKAPADVKKGM